jgi:hypothetical protein
LDIVFQPHISQLTIGRSEDVSNVIMHLSLHTFFRNIRPGISLKMKLAPLPRYAIEQALTSSTQAPQNINLIITVTGL